VSQLVLYSRRWPGNRKKKKKKTKKYYLRRTHKNGGKEKALNTDEREQEEG